MKGCIQLLRKFARYLRPYRRRFAAVQVMHLLAAGLMIMLPLFLKFLIDGIVGRNNAGALLPLIAAVLVTILLRAVIAYLRIYHGHEIAQSVTYDMRNDLYAHLQSQPMKFYDRERTGNLLARVVDDLNVVEEVTHHGPEAFLSTGVMIAGSLGVLLSLNWKLALACLWVVPLQAIVVYRIGGRMHRGFRGVRTAKSSLTSQLEESFSGIQVIKSFGRERHEKGRFADANRFHYDRRLDVIRPMAEMFPIAELLNGLSIVIALGLGGLLALRGNLSVGTLASFVLYLRSFLYPLLRLALSFEQITDFFASTERFFDYLSIHPEIRESPKAVHLPAIDGRIRFDDVHFSYRDDVPVLRGVAFDVAAGTTCALVGPTGSGKTTVIRLLMRLYDVTDGSVGIDGYDVRELTTRTLRNHIGGVMQDDYVFSGTIRDNIMYGRLNATEEEMRYAAREANAEEFIEKLPDAYATVVGQRGVMLSEGQRQRMTIARALLKNPRILVLDEATSSVDSETERLIQEALSRLLRGRTTVAIAHRLSTILNADQILYIRDGRITERGRHEELLERDGEYARLFYTQFKPASETHSRQN